MKGREEIEIGGMKEALQPSGEAWAKGSNSAPRNDLDADSKKHLNRDRAIEIQREASTRQMVSNVSLFQVGWLLVNHANQAACFNWASR